jgi:hypothetical protein
VKKLMTLAIGLVLLPAASAVSTAAVSPIAKSSRVPARIVIRDLAPLTVSGSGFASHERVTVTVTTKKRATRAIFANTAGRFTVRFATMSLERCSSYMVRAVGSKGSVVTKKVVPVCPPPAAPVTGVPDEPPLLYPNDPIPKKK